VAEAARVGYPIAINRADEATQGTQKREGLGHGRFARPIYHVSIPHRRFFLSRAVKTCQNAVLGERFKKRVFRSRFIGELIFRCGKPNSGVYSIESAWDCSRRCRVFLGFFEDSMRLHRGWQR
jgi:hypothetical protein